MERRSLADEIMMYGTLLGLPEEECIRMASGGTGRARRMCRDDLKRRYRNLYPPVATTEVPTDGLAQLDFWRGKVSDPFVYFVQHGNSGPVKIGLAGDPLDRMGNLQVGNPEQLHLRHVVPGDRRLERELHHRFREARVRGEWFGLSYLEIILIYAEGFSAEKIEGYQWAGEPLVEACGGQVRDLKPTERDEIHRTIERMWIARFPLEEIAENVNCFVGEGMVDVEGIEAEIREMRKMGIYDVGRRKAIVGLNGHVVGGAWARRRAA